MNDCPARLIGYRGYVHGCTLTANHEGQHSCLFPTGTEYRW